MNEIGVYVHFPWCLEKCPYCDFLSIRAPSPDPSRRATRDEARRALPHSGYADAIIRELEMRLARLGEAGPAPVLRSVFFGGGTPSLWDPRELGRVLAAVRSSFPASPAGVEITVECNPTSVDDEHFAALASEGVNRVSIGVQALEQERLSFLGRLHDPGGALVALEQAVRSPIERVSGDLIYGVYGQAPEAATADVMAVLDRGVTHLSAYALTIEENTRFGALAKRGQLPLLDDALVAASFDAVGRAAEARGLSQYEVSNFALPGHESVHNVGYWTGRDYLGLGVGAFGTVTLGEGRLRYKNHLVVERYSSAFARGRAPFDPFMAELAEREAIAPETSVSEAILLGLRLRDGLDPELVSERFGAPFWTEERRKTVARLLEKRDLSERHVEGRVLLGIPRERWLFADGIIRDLL